jgi:hypothetical protein
VFTGITRFSLKADPEMGTKTLQSVSQVGQRFHRQAPTLGIKYHIIFIDLFPHSTSCQLTDRRIPFLEIEWKPNLTLSSYSAGLRVSEVVKLRVQDIDTKRNMIHIKEAKGRKDRYTVFCYSSFRGWYRFTVYSGVTWA